MKKIICVFLSLLTIFVCCSCSAVGLTEKKEKYSASFLDLFETASTVVAYDTNESEFNEHFEQFYNKLKEYNDLYDIYNSYDGINNLYTLNQKAKDGPVKVDSRIIDLLEFCRYVYDFSGGKTNICFGAVLSLWHDSREYAIANPQDAKLPDMKKLKEAAEHTSFDSLVIDKENSTVYFSDPLLKLDVGAVAKGYAVQKVCEWAEENLWSSGAISIGGNIYTFGVKEDENDELWNIGIESPDPNASDYLTNVHITDLSVVTSGDYQRYFTVDGKKYCHIIDPDTLMPAQYVSSVSVICDDSGMGDALSTTLFNMPIEEGMSLVESLTGVEAVWVDQEYKEYYSSGFEKYIEE